MAAELTRPVDEVLTEVKKRARSRRRHRKAGLCAVVASLAISTAAIVTSSSEGRTSVDVVPAERDGGTLVDGTLPVVDVSVTTDVARLRITTGGDRFSKLGGSVCVSKTPLTDPEGGASGATGCFDADGPPVAAAVSQFNADPPFVSGLTRRDIRLVVFRLLDGTEVRATTGSDRALPQVRFYAVELPPATSSRPPFFSSVIGYNGEGKEVFSSEQIL